MIAAVNRRKPVTIIPCGKCGVEMEVQPCFVATKKYCSRDCASRGRPPKPKTGTHKNCETCGSEMYVTKKNATKRFCSTLCRVTGQTLTGAGSRRKDQNGYIVIYFPTHPDANGSGVVMEHRLVAEEKYGRRIKKTEHVHHLNGIRNDNRPENLVVMASRDHMVLTRKEENAMRVELAEYRRLYGPLNTHLKN